MIERRNFYRILHTQPDAPMAIIKENYRLLMQRLREHPGLSDSNWNADLLKEAFNTLGDPLKRTVYDRELLKTYRIEALSQGAFNLSTNAKSKKQKNNSTAKENQRNYYRILQILPDAPPAMITPSYQYLIKNSSHSTHNLELLDEAYKVLSDPLTRQQYDLAWAASNHASRAEQEIPIDYEITDLTDAKSAPQFTIESYRAVITNYCFFCKTPYKAQQSSYPQENCLECVSPLWYAQHDDMQLSHRTLKRIDIRGNFLFYLFWPSKPYEGLLQDLSPQGLRFLTEEPVYLHDVIKIDAPNLQAVAEVTHKSSEGEKFSVGVRFVTVKFDQQQGNFVAIEV